MGRASKTLVSFLKNIISFPCFLLSFYLLLSFLIAVNSPLKAQEKPVTVAITQIVEHPSLDVVREGILEILKKQGYIETKNLKIIYENAQGNVTTAAQIAKKLVGLNPDVIVAISTPSAQSAAAALKGYDIPLVFAAVSDPLSAQLVLNMEKPEGLITGATDNQPIEEQIELMKEIIPSLKTLGVLYNPGEINSVKIVEKLKQKADSFQILEATASKTNEVPASAQKLLETVDALYIPTDNMIVSALPAVLNIAFSSKKPVFSTDPDLVKQGVLASIGREYKDVGKLAGEMVVRLLNGEKPKDIPVQAPSKKHLYLNMKTAETLHMEIPKHLVKKALYKFS
jgi:putative ABC transport system substrate-binding protein